MLSNLRPRSASEIVDASVQLFRRHARILLVAAGLMVIPMWLASLMLSLYIPIMDATATPDISSAGIAWTLVAVMLTFVWLPVGFGALVHAAAGAYLQDAPTEPVAAYRRAIGHAVRLIVANILAMFLVFLVTALATVVIFIPLTSLTLLQLQSPILVGITAVLGVAFVAWAYCVEFGRALLVTPLVMLETRTIMSALRRSRVLSKGFANRTAGLILVTSVLYLAIAMGVVLMGEFVAGGSALANSVLSLLLILLYPAIACLMVVLYYDLRVRKEGLDMELLVGEEPAALG